MKPELKEDIIPIEKPSAIESANPTLRLSP